MRRDPRSARAVAFHIISTPTSRRRYNTRRNPLARTSDDPLPTRSGGELPAHPPLPASSDHQSPGDTAVMLPFTPIETPIRSSSASITPNGSMISVPTTIGSPCITRSCRRTSPSWPSTSLPSTTCRAPGSRSLIGLKRRVEAERGKLVLFRIQPFIHDLLRGMKLNTYFSIVECEQDALRAAPTSSSRLIAQSASLVTPACPP